MEMHILLTLAYIFINNLQDVRSISQEHGFYSYYFSESESNWSEARSHCIDMGGELASITSMDESYLLNNILTNERSKGHWIGLQGDTKESEFCRCDPNDHCDVMSESQCCICRKAWSWTDGTEMDFTNWMPNEPTGGQECGRIDHPNSTTRGSAGVQIFSWFDVSCEKSYHYICKLPNDGSNPTNNDSTERIINDQTGMSDKRQDNSVIIGVSVGLGAALLAVVLVIIILLLYRKKKKSNRKQQSAEGHYDEISAAEYVNQAAITNDNQKPSPSTTSDPQYSTSYAQVILPANKKPKPLSPKPAVEKEIKYADIDFGDSPVTHTQNGNEYSSAGSLYNQPHLSYDEDSLGYARTEGVSGVDTHNNNKPTPISPEQISAMYATPVKKNKAKKPEVLRKPAANNPGVMYAVPVKK